MVSMVWGAAGVFLPARTCPTSAWAHPQTDLGFGDLVICDLVIRVLTLVIGDL